MRKVKFPLRRDDGSFCIEIGLSVTSEDGAYLTADIKNWISADWLPNNMTWKREWRTGNSAEMNNEQILSYETEFLGAPEVVWLELSALQINLTGKATARFWKDWLISRFLPDLRAKFPEVGHQLYLRDCEA